jgi:phosphatidylinositol glycan class O
VHQTDLVPTLALLLGAPIPFSSVGAVLPELFGKEGAALEALRLNAHQVVRFFQAYEEATGASREAVAHLVEQLSAADEAALADTDAAVSVKDRYADVLATAREVAERTWSTFDVGAMIAGALLGVVTGASAMLAPMQLLRPWGFMVSVREVKVR